MIYIVSFTRRSLRELADLPRDVYPRVKAAIGALATNPRPAGCIKLSGREGWRIREGDYRVIFTIDDPSRAVTVEHIGHRREVYRG